MNFTPVLQLLLLLWRAQKFTLDLHFQRAIQFLAVILNISITLLIFHFLKILFACVKVYDSGTRFALHVATPVELAVAPFV